MLSHTVSSGRGVLRDFEAAERSRGLRSTSIGKRVAMVRRWWRWVDEPFDPEVTWRDVEAWLETTGMVAARSRYDAISHLHQFYVWAQRAELVDRDPTVLVVRPRMSPGLPRPAHDVELAIGLAFAVGPLRVAIALAAGSGLRCVELARLRWVDVYPNGVARVRGKGDRDRVVPIHAEAWRVLEELDRVDDFVLPWREADDISPGRRVSHTINRHFRELGCSTTAHQLRHWCATSAMAAGNRLEDVQDLLGHASANTTRIYARLDPGRLTHVTASFDLPTGVAA